MPALIGKFALLSPPYATLSYALPGCFTERFWKPGLRCAVPLGKGLRAAVFQGFEAEDGGAEKGFTLKEAAWPLENAPILPGEYLDFVAQLALRQAETPGRILGGLLPAGLRTAQARWRFFGRGKPEEISLRELAALPEEEKKRLAELLENGLAVFVKGRAKAENDLCLLASDPPWAVKPSARKQMELLDFLLENGAVNRKRLVKNLGDGASQTLDLLAERGLVKIQPAGFFIAEALPGREAMEKDRSDPENAPCPLSSPAPYTFTSEQQAALDALAASMENTAGSGNTETHLLYGLTGSGKTAVYLEFAAEVLRRGRSVLLLAPEVALALKLRSDAQKRFPRFPVYLSHGYQPPAAREACFCELAHKNPEEASLVVGTRSALFLPLRNIGAIILDEEHDGSFKQDEGLHYQAKDLAWYRASRNGAPLVLGSATPDLKSFYAARQGNIAMHRLSTRVGGGRLPEVKLVNLQRNAAARELLAEESLNALKETVERGDQAMILLNRRGYAPLMYCLACGTVPKCPHCDIALTYHKGRERMVCHYCGHSVNFPTPCQCCRNMRYLPMGQGTEKLEEGLSEILPPSCRILRLDRDSTRRPGRMEEILAAFGRGEAEVLVGTQMLSKGHHFPRVTLAVVADGDLGLNLPDYRAAERTFQLLVQASGRAGRGLDAGRVLIQTRDPAHYCWQYVLNCDYEGFYEQEIALRRKRGYPPFVNLALARFAFPLDQADGQEIMARAGAAMQETGRELGVRVLGPAPAPLPMLKGQRRFQCLLKGQNWRNIRQTYAAGLARIPGQGGGRFRAALDLDPVNML